MDFANILKLTLGGIILLALGLALGYWYAPDKVKTVEKVVEKTITEKDTKTTKEYDPTTGKLTKEVHETKDKLTNIESNEKTVEKSKTQKQFALKGGVAINPRNLSGKLIPRFGLETRIPLWDLSLGVEADININQPLIGTYLRLGF